jgi:hypothetical protein
MARFCIDSSKYDPNFHTIISGPYQNLSLCYSPCGANDPSITTTSTTTTQSPNSVSPPLTSRSQIANINDVPAIIDVQYFYGPIWHPLTTLVVNANSIINVSNSNETLRGRASIPDSMPSAWSNEYNYTNPDNIIVPTTNGNAVNNTNSFAVIAEIQYFSGTFWIPYILVSINANSTYRAGAGDAYNILRARFAKVGPGTSVTPWSS